MSGEGQRTQAAVRRSRWPGWIWAVPIVAVVIVGWLVLRQVINQGPTVTVTFDQSGGVKAGDTAVRYKGMNVGTVDDVSLSKDLHHVVMKLELDSSVENALRSGTRFWIVGASVDSVDLASLKTILSGSYIEMDPGPGKPTRNFVGLDRPAPVPAEAAGRRFLLHAQKLDVSAGASVYYLGLAVGKVESAKLGNDGRNFDIAVFIDAPYDKFVHAGSVFFDAGAVRISTEGGGLSAHLTAVSALLTGAVGFDTSPAAAKGPVATAGQGYRLYASEDAALGAPAGPRISYLVKFDGTVGDLKPGAAVKLRGFRIGSVTDVSLAYDVADGKLETPVTIEIEPGRLKLAGVTLPADGNWRPLLDRALDHLITEGLRARLDQSPPFVGGHIVVLDSTPGTKPAHLIMGGALPQIPATAGGSIAGLAGQASKIMAKINAMPLSEIAANLHQAIGHLDHLVASPKLTQSLDHLDRTLANLQRVTASATGKVGPLIESLRRTADATHQTIALANSVLGGNSGDQNRDLPQALYELTNAARSIRELANYLDRHPEAVLEGKSGP